MTKQSFEDQINNINDENVLRQIRSAADCQLQKVKNKKAASNIGNLIEKYKGHYILLYGREYTLRNSYKNVHHKKIFLVDDITSAAYGFFMASGKLLEIEYDCNPYNSHLTDISPNNKGGVQISSHDCMAERIDVSDIESILTADDVEKIKTETIDNVNRLLKGWGA